MQDYILSTVERIAKRECKGKGKKFADSFKVGMAQNIATRIQALIKQDQEVGSECYGLVVSEKASIDNYLKELGAKNAPKQSSKSLDANAYNQGAQAGKGVGLDKRVQGSFNKNLMIS